MESLIYVLVHLYNGTVPWQFVEVGKNDNFVNIMNYKRHSSSQKLIGNMPRGFTKIVDYIRKLQFTDLPDYDYLRWLFGELARDNKVIIDHQFNWAEGMS